MGFACLKSYIVLAVLITAIFIGYKVAVEETENFGVMRRRRYRYYHPYPYRYYRPWYWHDYFSPYSWYYYWRPPYNYSQVSPIISNIN
jgi:hypothetical protein